MNDFDLTDFPLQKQFEFYKVSGLINEINNIDSAKEIAKQYLYLYMATQATVGKLANWKV